MRVIAGDVKGRKLTAVPGRSTRPTTDKVKESVFNIIGPYFDGGEALDLFAGTGGLGIEALSRGMDQAVFIDKDPKALQVVKKNLETCGLLERAAVYRNDAGKALKQLAENHRKFKLVFLDPPYHMDVIPKLMESMQDLELLDDEAIVVAEHDADRDLPGSIGNLDCWKHVEYGDIAVSFYRKGTS